MTNLAPTWPFGRRLLTAALALAALALSLASAVPPVRAAGASGTIGVMSTAVIVGTFSDSTGEVDTSAIRAAFQGSPGADVASYFAEASYGKLTVAPSFFGPFTLPVSRSSGCNNRPNQQLIDAAAASVTYSQFSRLVLVYDCPGSDFGSATRVGPVGTPQGTVQAAQVTLDARSAADVWSVSHELSHTLGDFNSHAAFYVCLPEAFVAPSRFGGDDDASRRSTATRSTRSGAARRGKPPARPDSQGERRLAERGAVPHRHPVGTFTLAPYETASGTQPLALNIPRGNSGTAFTVEYRQPIGFDAWIGRRERLPRLHGYARRLDPARAGR